MCDFAGEIKQNPAGTLAPIGTIMSTIGSLVSAGTAPWEFFVEEPSFRHRGVAGPPNGGAIILCAGIPADRI